MSSPRSGSAEKVLLRYQPYFSNSLALLSKARQGLSPAAVYDFITLTEWSDKKVETTLNKSMKTVQSQKLKKIVLDTVTSEKLLKLFALYSRGTSVFGSVEAFTDWLSRPAYGIGSRVPDELLDTLTGIELITYELTRIKYGDLA